MSGDLWAAKPPENQHDRAQRAQRELVAKLRARRGEWLRLPDGWPDGNPLTPVLCGFRVKVDDDGVMWVSWPEDGDR